MRILKFRAWDKKLKSMMFWKHLKNECFETIIKLYDVMQYTNFSDKKGKEIYEGDIIIGTYNDYNKDNKGIKIKGKIIFNLGYFGVSLKDYRIIPLMFFLKLSKKNDKEFIYFDLEKEIRLEIIGNIYENKNLLDKS